MQGKPPGPAKVPKPALQAQEDAVLSPEIHHAILQAVKEGALSKAAQLLTQERGVLPPDTRRQLCLLHPTSDLPTVPQPVQPELGALEPFTPDVVRKALHSFGTSAGPSGLRPRQLRQCLKGPGLADDTRGTGVCSHTLGEWNCKPSSGTCLFYVRL